MASLLVKILMAALGASTVKSGIEMWLKHTLLNQQMGVEKQRLNAEMLAAKLTNEENRRQADQFMTMYQTEKAEGRKEKAKDRQMQLLGAMLAAQGQMRQAVVDTQVAINRPRPPTALTTLLRGE